MSQNTVSLQLTKNQTDRLKDILVENSWFEDSINNEYISLRMKNQNGSVCTLYTSMKVVFQGNEDFNILVNNIKGNEDFNIEPHLGVDEVGKGDYFGPLVVVSCFVNSDFLKEFSVLGIGDSKKFSDSSIRKMYEKLKNYKYYYASVLNPSEYNRRYKEFKNVAIMLAKQHSKVIEMGLKDLKDRNIECRKVVIDQFSSKGSRVIDELGPLAKKVEFTQFHKGENDLAVATASIIARGVFLEEMEKLNKQYYFNFPKGASNVISSAREFVKQHGSKELENVAKISFKTTKKVMQTSF
jgi:ribonuclease HIII